MISPLWQSLRPRFFYLLFSAGVVMAAIGCETPPDKAPSTSTPPSTTTESPLSEPTNPTPREPRADDWFEDKTAGSGVDFTYRNGREGEQYTVLETVGGGVAAFDYDRDGDIDLFFPGGGKISAAPIQTQGRAPALYRNDGDWHFSDVTTEAGLSEPGDYSLGCAVGDYNRDGFPDLLVTCYGKSRLWRNNEGRDFTDVTDEAGLQLEGLSSAATFADIDRDGWPDLYVVGYLRGNFAENYICGDTIRDIRDVCGPRIYEAAADRLLRNRGDGTFEDISEQAGIRDDGKGLGVIAADLNQDGWLDFYVANDTTANHLYLGGPTLPLRETGLLAGVAMDENGTPQGSMGIDFGDYDGDGIGDLWVTNFEREHNTLYRGLGGGEFVDATLSAKLLNVSRPEVGFGTGLVDFNADGWLDLFVINGHVAYSTGQSPYLQPAFVFENMKGESFTDRSDKAAPYFDAKHAGRGAAVADLDNDGASDLIIVHQNGPVTLLKNRMPPKYWQRVEFRGVQSDPEAVGAQVAVEFQGRTLIRSLVGGAGYLSHFDPRLILPAENDQPRDVVVTWPNGQRERFPRVLQGRTVQLREGDGEDAG